MGWTLPFPCSRVQEKGWLAERIKSGSADDAGTAQKESSLRYRSRGGGAHVQPVASWRRGSCRRASVAPSRRKAGGVGGRGALRSQRLLKGVRVIFGKGTVQ